MRSCTTSAVAGSPEVLVTTSVTVAVCPAASAGTALIVSARVRAEPRGELRSACMSIATGAIARSVIRDAEPSTKNAVDENRPAASATPTTEAKVRRGLRRRSRRLYLSNPSSGTVADPLAIAECHHPFEASRDIRVVGDNDQGRTNRCLGLEQEVQT